MLLVKKFIFFLYLFLVKIRLETRFNSILDRKETFFDYKKVFPSPLNRIFPKGLTHALGEKMLNVSLFRFCQQKMLNNFVEKKDTFLLFWSKIGHFSISCF